MEAELLLPVFRFLQLSPFRAERVDAPELTIPLGNLAREHDCFAVRREDRSTVLALVIARQLAQQLSILAIEIDVGMAGALGLQIANGHRQFSRAVRRRSDVRRHHPARDER